MFQIFHTDTHVINRGNAIPAQSWESLRSLGNFTHCPQTTDVDQFLRCAKNAHAVITMRSPITRQMIYSAPNLRYIGSNTVGFDHIDLEAANERGITVTHVPGHIAARAVAQGTMALLLHLTNHVAHYSRPETFDNWRRDGAWAHIDECPDRQIYDLEGKTVGLIGFGEIGQCFADMVRPFKVNILAMTRRYKKGDVHPAHPDVEFCELPELFSRADIVSLHCPYTTENHHLISEDTIGEMKKGVFILNTARGKLVDEWALTAALLSGKVKGAGVDVLSTEPPDHDNPLLSAPRCYVTPHITWSAQTVRQRYFDEAVRNLAAFIDNKPRNVVNNPVPRPASAAALPV